MLAQADTTAWVCNQAMVVYKALDLVEEKDFRSPLTPRITALIQARHAIHAAWPH
jgi:hypothetical protein